MKIDKLLQLTLFVAMSSVSHASSYLLFPSDGGVQYAPLTGSEWNPSPDTILGTAGDARAWYDTIGSHTAVSVGAYFDDYDGVGPSFSVDHTLSPTLALTDSYLAWNFTITDYTGNFDTSRNDYSFSLLDGSSSELATIRFKNNGDNTWNVSLNNQTSFRAVEAGFNYSLLVSFATSGADAIATAKFGDTPLFTSSSTILGGATANVGHIQIGETLGLGNTAFGDGYITVAVPEPGTTMLIALLPAVFVIRRRR